MFRVVRITAVVLAFAAVAPPAGGQEVETVPRVTVGSRVRVFAPDLREDRYVGRVDSLAPTVMVLDTARTRTRFGLDLGPVLVDRYRLVTIRLSEIERIEVYGGKTTVAATVRGALIGALAGGLLLGLGNLPEVNPSSSDFIKDAPKGVIVGGMIGGVIGWMLGDERWLPAVVPR